MLLRESEHILFIEYSIFVCRWFVFLLLQPYPDLFSDPSHIPDANNVIAAMLVSKAPVPRTNTTTTTTTAAMMTGTVIFSFTLLWSTALVLGAKQETVDLKGPASTVDGPTVEGSEFDSNFWLILQ